MKKINFNQYPNILPYIEKHLDKNYCKPFEPSDLDEETYISIITDFIKEYEKHKDILIKNTLLVYDLTNEETGYQCLSQDWDRWRKTLSKNPKKISKELVEEWWNDKISACILHIYQSLQYDGKSIEGGIGGCLITVHYSIKFYNHEKKGYKYNVVTDFSFNLNLGHSFHNEYDLCE